jgi:hypothetical protein
MPMNEDKHSSGMNPHGDASRPEEDAINADKVSRHYGNLVADLARSLDLSAGLTLASLTQEHASLVEDITDVLQVRSALKLLAPEPEASPATMRDRLRYQAADISTLGGLIEWLNSYPIAERLDFRTHTASLVHSSGRECGCTTTRRVMMDYVKKESDALRASADRVPAEGFAPGSELVLLLDELGGTLERAASCTQSLDTDLHDVRASVSSIFHYLQDFSASAQLRDAWEDLLRSLGALEKSMNDFTDSDLSAVELDGVRLSGIRWSKATKWPAGWRTRVADYSSEISPGVFEIGDRPQTRGPSVL